MLSVQTDPALHTGVPDTESEMTSDYGSKIEPMSPITFGIEDYPVFDSNMVAEQVSDYGTVVSELDEETQSR